MIKIALSCWLILLTMFIGCEQKTYSSISENKEQKQLPLPKKLAIYYGYPSLVNLSNTDLHVAASTFDEYDFVVFGDGLEFLDVVPSRLPAGAGAKEYENTRRIIESLKNSQKHTQVYGYVDLGNSQKLSLEELDRRIEFWSEMGVAGIFLDEAGYDFGVTRARQNAAVTSVHKRKLSAFLNAYNLSDIFDQKVIPLNQAGGGNPSGEACLLGNNDLALIESFQIRNGEFDDDSPARILQATQYREKFGTKLIGVTTLLPNQKFNQAQHDYAWWSAVLWAMDGFGWGEPNFSSSDNLLPKHELPELPKQGLGSRFTSEVIDKKPKFFRKTDQGKIFIDLEQHIGYFKEN